MLGSLDRVGLVKFLAFHPDGDRLAVADYGRGEGPPLGSRGGHVRSPSRGRAGVSCVGFTPDGKRLAALGYDGNVHLADARTGDEVLVLRGFGPPPGGERIHAPAGLQPRRSPDRRPYAIGRS